MISSPRIAGGSKERRHEAKSIEEHRAEKFG